MTLVRAWRLSLPCQRFLHQGSCGPPASSLQPLASSTLQHKTDAWSLQTAPKLLRIHLLIPHSPSRSGLVQPQPEECEPFPASPPLRPAERGWGLQAILTGNELGLAFPITSCSADPDPVFSETGYCTFQSFFPMPQEAWLSGLFPSMGRPSPCAERLQLGGWLKGH